MMFEGWFTTTNMVIIFGVISIVAGLFYTFYKATPKIKVDYLSTIDSKGKTYQVEKETPTMLFTKGGYRFYRNERSFTFPDEGGVTKYYAKRGGAYTFGFKDSVQVKITLFETMILLWGEKVVNDLKDEYKNLLKESKIYVTVDIEKEIVPEGFVNTSENIKVEANRNLAELVAKAATDQLKSKDWILLGFAAMSGMGFYLLLKAFGIVK